MLATPFWIFLIIVIYTFVGYAFLLWIFVWVKKLFHKSEEKDQTNENLPDVCLLVAAYNEVSYVDDKIANSFQLDYPADKIQYLWISDGSDDGTNKKLEKYSGIQVEFLPERKGKVNAINTGMKLVKSDIVIFSDCNTMLGQGTIMEFVRKFRNPKVGCVAGEKRIVQKENDNATNTGESLYWRFESWIKKMDAEFNSAIGADGGVFAIRRELFEEVGRNIVLDDFVISLKIAQKGYKIDYAPNAYAVETASANIKEELKRKVRIAAGAIQTMRMLPDLLNPFRYGWLSFQYFSHKVLRWIFAPFALIGVFFTNLILVVNGNDILSRFYGTFFLFQLIMYFFAVVGWLLRSHETRYKWLFVPYYFVMMNFASVLGIFRFFNGKQSVKWEKAKRA
ncbi:MAG TPA: glycosyltransferase family 2 protein [Draconibacterium sp.]|nr:glycosyltransferase family 2 protein [Draconibacterium sp.]